MLTRFLLISAKCLAVGNEYCTSKIQREVWNKKMLRRIYLLSRSPKSSSVFSVKIRVGTSLRSRQRKFLATFWALCHAALNERGASGTCEGSAVAYVEGEATFRTLDYSLSLRQDRSLRFDFQKRDSPIALLKDYGKRILFYLGFVLAHRFFTYTMNRFIFGAFFDTFS